MRIPDEVLKSVVFLGVEQTDGQTGATREELKGTAFFVALQTGRTTQIFCLVTARHVARQLEKRRFFVRANTKSGKAASYWLEGGINAHWVHHPTDETVDASVLLWTPPEEADYLCLHQDMFLNDEKIASARIGVGDEVYVAGLFRFHRGQERNEPVIRSGHIAMVPKERLPDVDWHPDGIEGYLIEARSIGGFSGAPVIVQRSIEVQAVETSGRVPLAAGAIFWLGLMHGHWNATPKDIDGVDVVDTADPEKKINAGIAIVVPCKKIVEIFNHDAIRDACARAAGASEAEMEAVVASKAARPPLGLRLSVATSAAYSGDLDISQHLKRIDDALKNRGGKS